MSIKITCPSCDEVFSVADNMRGKKVACRECDKTIVVPKGKGKAADEDDEDKDKIRKGTPAKLAAAGAGRRFRDADDDEEDADDIEDAEDGDDEDDDEEDSKKKKKKKSMMPLLLIGGGLGLAAVAAVVLIIVMGGRNSDAAPKNDQPANNTPIAQNPPQGGNNFTPPQGGDPKPEDTKRDNEPKKDPKAEETEPQPVVITSMSGVKLYQRLLKSTVWIVATQGGGGTGPLTGGGGGNQNDLANSSWSGSENLKGFGKLEFQFGASGNVTMTDAAGKSNGTYTQSGNNITLSFPGSSVYTGTISGQTMSGTAKDDKGTWTWNVTRQGGGGGGFPMPPGGGFPGGGKGPGGFPMPPGGGFPGGGKGPGGFPMPPGGGGGFPMPPGGGVGGNQPMQFPGGFPKQGNFMGQGPGGFPKPGQQMGGGFQGGFPGGKGPLPGQLPPGVGGKGPGGKMPPGFGPGPGDGGGTKIAVMMGSGSLIDKKHSLVLTNVHVVGTADTVTVYFPTYENGKLVRSKSAYLKMPGIKGRVVMKEERADIALVQLEKVPDSAKVLPMSTTGASAAQQVHSMGNPGASTGLWCYSPGKVRGEPYKDKWPVLVDEQSGKTMEMDAMKLETDSAINQGDSGGPLVDDRCVLVGVAHASHIKAQNMSLFIDVSECRALITKYYKSRNETWVPEPEPRAEEEIARIPELIKKLRHKEFTVRLGAVQALGSLGKDATLAFSPLFNAMKDTDNVVKRAVTDALEKVPPHKGDVDMLCKACENSQEPMEVRMQAAKSLGKLGPDAKSALRVLTKQIKEGDPSLRLSAFSAMIAIGPEAQDVPILADALKASDPEFRRLAAEALAKLGPLAKPAIPALLANLKSKDKALRLIAMRALETMGVEAKEAAPALTEVMQDSDAEVATFAAIALAKVSGDRKETIAFLRKALRNNDGALKKRAAQGLGDLRPQDKFVVKDLLGALADDQARAEVKIALVKIGKFGADQIALAMIQNFKTSEAARLACIEALGEIGAQSLTIGQALTTIVRGDTEDNKKAAMRVWEKLTGTKLKTSVGPGGQGPGGFGPGR